MRDYAQIKATFHLECPLCGKLFERNINSLISPPSLRNLCDKIRFHQENQSKNLQQITDKHQFQYLDFKITKEEIPNLITKWFSELWFKPAGFEKDSILQDSNLIQGDSHFFDFSKIDSFYLCSVFPFQII